MIVENLKELLVDQYNTSEPWYLGCKFKKFVHQGEPALLILPAGSINFFLIILFDCNKLHSIFPKPKP